MTAAGGMPCPICRVPLVMSERQGVEIDYCPQCRGVWLDRGELDKIIERSAAELSAQAPPPPKQPPLSQPPSYAQPSYQHHQHDAWPARGHDPYRQSHGKPPKRRKSFLEELFD
ncbi:zf-TFIIB domain-containing protein [Sphingomonas sp. IC4-52]|uniref:TFIIB-type zinc ribbon-containing protein n=1 Tax=Sphingomonas sp. IC4-52 TaxID=2887202 RepID=UPI001D12677F|nr:zf-TFIIB domain-containing protein [Sphingomonas sp. IC4-52]MCC2981025.1 zf-TFIIB domain-containing protein [Sphingomonas sp. IC4-52]